MREIKLSRGQVAIVDDADFEWLNQHKWSAATYKGRFRAVRSCGPSAKRIFVYMHRQILGLEPGDPREGDHVEPSQTLDNRRINLRISTHQQNLCNQGKRKTNTSGFKGVSPHRGMFRATIYHNWKQIHLGYRNTAKAAHFDLYVPAAKRLHGDFARI